MLFSKCYHTFRFSLFGEERVNFYPWIKKEMGYIKKIFQSVWKGHVLKRVTNLTIKWEIGHFIKIMGNISNIGHLFWLYKVLLIEKQTPTLWSWENKTWHGLISTFGADCLGWNTNSWLDSDWTGMESEGWDGVVVSRGGHVHPRGLYYEDSSLVSAREELQSSWWDERILDVEMMGHEDSVKSHKLIFCERNRDANSFSTSDCRTRYLSILWAVVPCQFLWCRGLAKVPDPLPEHKRPVFHPMHMILILEWKLHPFLLNFTSWSWPGF